MAWRRPGDKPLSEPMMVISLTHICVTRPQWVKDIFGFFLQMYLLGPVIQNYTHICVHLAMHRPNHYFEIMSTMASQITRVSIVAQMIVREQIKENIKAPRHWSLWGEPLVTGGFHSQRASNAENVSIGWYRATSVSPKCWDTNDQQIYLTILHSQPNIKMHFMKNSEAWLTKIFP